MKPKRYNLGFGWFGPLEQSDDGKLMLADEAIQEIEERKRHFNETVMLYLQQKDLYGDLFLEYTALNKLYGEQKSRLLDEIDRTTKLSAAIWILLATAVIEAVLLVFVVWG